MVLRRQEVLKQINFIAIESLPIVLICVSFAAMVTILESSFHMKLVIQNDSMVPGFAVLLILRELGVVVSALLLTSRVGAGIAAEVGLMKITEQLEALKMLGIEPIRYLLLPRLIAGIICGAVISIIANIVCILCAMLVSEFYLGFTSSMFMTAMIRFVDFQDIIFSTIKGAVFGAIIPLVSCYFGFKCKPGASGVGETTTNSVVVASVLIIMVDFLLTFVFSRFY